MKTDPKRGKPDKEPLAGTILFLVMEFICTPPVSVRRFVRWHWNHTYFKRKPK